MESLISGVLPETTKNMANTDHYRGDEMRHM